MKQARQSMWVPFSQHKVWGERGGSVRAFTVSLAYSSLKMCPSSRSR